MSSKLRNLLRYVSENNTHRITEVRLALLSLHALYLTQF